MKHHLAFQGNGFVVRCLIGPTFRNYKGHFLRMDGCKEGFSAVVVKGFLPNPILHNTGDRSFDEAYDDLCYVCEMFVKGQQFGAVLHG